MDVKGKVVVVTGASQGIGLATARLFAARGAKVALVARSAALLDQLARELPDSVAIECDMSDDDAVRAMIRKVMDRYGRIDVLVNNAGRAMHVTIETADVAKYRQLLDLNVVSVLLAMQEVIPIMRRQGGGAILNVTSGVSKRTIPNLAPYASSKAALNMLTLTARAELAKDNISVGLVYPGFTTTDFHKNAIDYRVDITLPTPPSDPPEHVAEKILEAAMTGEAEVFADSLQPVS